MEWQKIWHSLFQGIILASITGASICLAEEMAEGNLKMSGRHSRLQEGSRVDAAHFGGLVNRFEFARNAAPGEASSEIESSVQTPQPPSPAALNPPLFRRPPVFGAKVLALSLAMLLLIQLLPLTGRNLVTDTLNSRLHYGLHGFGRLSGFTLARRKVLIFLLGLTAVSGLYDLAKSLFVRRHLHRREMFVSTTKEALLKGPETPPLHAFLLLLAGLLTMIGVAPQREELSSEATFLLKRNVGLKFPSLTLGSLLLSASIGCLLLQRMHLLRERDEATPVRHPQAETVGGTQQPSIRE